MAGDNNHASTRGCAYAVISKDRYAYPHRSPQDKKWLLAKGLDAGGAPIPEWSVDGALEDTEANEIETGILSITTPGARQRGGTARTFREKARAPWRRRALFANSSQPRRRGRTADHLGVYVYRMRSSDQIALNRVARFGGEEGELFLGLGALGEHGKFEAAGESQHRAHDRGRMRVARDVADEIAVDLDLV